ncbi:glycosyltransferase [Paraeggerthella sp. Marseille-Q4926]|uniref:glycosyltransferase n=1 Tax=Paraeggerthella sp. Marseille-Q4926 TaxID=2866587 RepID=UPI001CE4114D|nr:glycosyltransferase [Paraeggerthella sp. Marseille-Q4926]
MSVYGKESPQYLRESIESLLAQTVKPYEIVVVEDGFLTPELDCVLNRFDNSYPGLFKLVSYKENRGLGFALEQGVLSCECEFIARMDTDDVAHPRRIEKQLDAFEADPFLDMLGSQVIEFVSSPKEPVSCSDLPEEPKDIAEYSKRRNPFRHPSMMFKKSKVIEAGNYSSDFLFFEDWDLFNRMLSHGCKARNLHEVLVAMRVSVDFFARRGGRKYLGHAYEFKKAQLRSGYFAPADFCVSFFPHAAVCMMPNSIRSFVYKRLLRKSNNDIEIKVGK